MHRIQPLHAGRLALMAFACALPMAAGITVSVEANGPSGGSSETETYFNSPSAHGSALVGSTGDGNAGVVPGTGPGPCFMGFIANVAASSCAVVDASKGILRAGGSSLSNFGSFGSASAIIDDTILFHSNFGTFDIRLDFIYSSFGVGAAGLTFAILAESDSEGEPYFCIYCFEMNTAGVDFDSSTRWRITKVNGFLLPVVTYGSVIPTHIVDTVTGLVPSQANIRFLLAASGECPDTGEPCSAWADGQNTAYIGISTPHTSSSGYSYLGFTESGVPEPGSALLCLVGLALALAKHRGTAPPQTNERGNP